MIWNIIPVIAVGGSALHLLPQIWKSIKKGQTGGLSWSMLFLHLISNIAWLSYGMHIADVPLTLVSALNVMADTTLLIIKYKRD